MSDVAPSEPRPAVFVDRDNTLIDDPGYLRDPAQVRLLPGVAQAVARLRAEGFPVVVVSNQSGVARGYFTEDELALVHQRMQDLLRKEGDGVDAIYYCPYLTGPDAVLEEYRRDSDLRKPKPGMLFKAAEEMRLDLSLSWMVGDSSRDVQAGRSAGCRTIMIGKAALKTEVMPDYFAADVPRAADIIIGELHNARTRAAAEKAAAETRAREEALAAEKAQRAAEAAERARQAEAEARQRAEREAQARAEREARERARQEAEAAERARIQAEAAAKSRAEAEERERAAAERARAEREATERARAEAEAAERQREKAEAAERARLDAERAERERVRVEAERVHAEREREQMARTTGKTATENERGQGANAGSADRYASTLTRTAISHAAEEEPDASGPAAAADEEPARTLVQETMRSYRTPLKPERSRNDDDGAAAAREDAFRLRSDPEAETVQPRTEVEAHPTSHAREAGRAGETGATSNQSEVLLSQILDELRATRREQRFTEFSFAQLAGAIAQAFALCAVGFGLYSAIGGDLPGAQVRLLLGIAFQMMALSGFIISRRK